MLNDVTWACDGTYRPGEEFSPERFFNDGLMNSSEFDLQLGYFSSATISVLAVGFASFISRGGRMRLVINQMVSEKDKVAIGRGMAGEVSDCFDLTDFKQLWNTFDAYQKQFFDCLAYLIQEGRIEIRIVRPAGKRGIAHTKSGQFRDGESITSFTGSANFTIGGLFNNLEEIKIDRSDSLDAMTQNRLASQRKEFEALMNRQKTNVEYLSSDQLIAVVKEMSGNHDVEELLQVEENLSRVRRYREEKESPPGGLAEEYEAMRPSFPFPSGPRPYQKTAFENWMGNGQKGLFAMATGTGKTITALNCLLEIYIRKRYYKGLILVPTITLVQQWEVECRKFHFGNIIKVCSKNPGWQDEVDRIAFDEKYTTNENSTPSYIIIATYASFSREKIFDALTGFDKRRLLLIADECHNMGSQTMIQRLKRVPYQRRIGLSATPERQFDDRGNDRLRSFFGAQDGYTYEYSMKEAIDNGVLCRYLYYPHIIHLTPVEMQAYSELSVKISKYYNYSTESFDKADDILKRLLLARKRIIHKAAGKLEVFRTIMQRRFAAKGDLGYSLVYVPEGNFPDYLQDADCFVDTDEIPEDDDTDRLINAYTAVVKDVDEHVTVRKFVAGQSDRETILRDFECGRLQVLTSMKCLDEGVDVPRSELAVFCSSTGNPRQFIQRRGRVLRTHPDKKMAELHDLIVAPIVGYDFETYNMERSLLKTELLRVSNFALLSENPSCSELELREIIDYYGLNLYKN